MSDSIARLLARVQNDYLDNGHIPLLIDDYNAVARVGNYTAQQATAAAASAAAAANSYALMVALGASAYGVGIDLADLVRAGQLGGMAFMEPTTTLGRFVNTKDETYQIRPDDFAKVLLLTSGTRTHTLPLAADLPEGWWCMWNNRSGNNYTVNRSGTDTFNAAATTIALSTGDWGFIIRTSSSTFEVF